MTTTAAHLSSISQRWPSLSLRSMWGSPKGSWICVNDPTARPVSAGPVSAGPVSAGPVSVTEVEISFWNTPWHQEVSDYPPTWLIGSMLILSYPSEISTWKEPPCDLLLLMSGGFSLGNHRTQWCQVRSCDESCSWVGHFFFVVQRCVGIDPSV